MIFALSPSRTMATNSPGSFPSGSIRPAPLNSRPSIRFYRLGNNKGFRVVGQISQDLDLFRMPVQ